MGTRCHCENPAGETNCPDGFFAICRVKNRKCNGMCIPIQRGQTIQQFHNFVLSVVTEERRTPDQFLSYDDNYILNSGRFSRTLPNGDEIIVTFNLPDDDELLNLGIEVGLFA